MPDTPLGPDDRVIVAGASGLIGRALVTSLRGRGVTVVRLVRRDAVRDDEIAWQPTEGLDPDTIRGARAVVVLNGASIGRLPWTANYREELLRSRLVPLTAASSAVAALGEDAPQLLHASAVGFYGSRPLGAVDEDSERGRGFLADLCHTLESTARRIAGDATALRIAPVIHEQGVLRPLLTLTRLGIAGPLGAGTQVWPWISLDDTVAAIVHAIEHQLRGPVNVVGPTRATMNDVGFAVAVRLNRPYLLRAPAFALRLALGPAADGLLLSDTHVVPDRLQVTGFRWRQETASDAVAHALPLS